MEILRKGDPLRVLQCAKYWCRRQHCRSCNTLVEFKAHHLYYLSPPPICHIGAEIAFQCPLCDSENQVEFEFQDVIPISINWTKKIWRQRINSCLETQALAPVPVHPQPLPDDIFTCHNCEAVFRAVPADFSVSQAALDHNAIGPAGTLNCPCCHQPVKTK